MSQRARGLIIVFLMLIVSFLLIFTGCGSQQAKTIDPPRIAEYNKPGTVYIETSWKADVTVTNVTINETALYNKLAPLAVSGAISTDDQIVTAIVDELINNPSLYIVPGTGTRTMSAETAASGSGFIITPDGYAVTNAHVVKMTDAELKRAMALTALSDLVKKDISDLETSLGISLTKDQTSKMEEALATAYAAYLTISNQSSKSQMLMGVAVPGVGTIQKGLACEIVKIGEPSPGKDVAILKVNSTNLPTVALGDDTAVREGDQAIALGYPGAATFNPLIDQTEENIKPSLTVGSVSGRKTMSGGWEVLQIDTAVTHGNSGGPLFNNKGEVIGITTFGSVNQNSQTGAMEEVQGFNFAVPTTVVKQFLTETNIQPTQGSLTKTYHEAVDLAADQHYSAAKEKFKEVSDSNPAFPYVADEIANCTAKINDGLDKSTFPIPMWLLVVLFIVIIGGVAAAVFFLVIKKKPTGGAGTPARAVPPKPQAPAPAAAPAVEPAGPAQAPAEPAPAPTVEMTPPPAKEAPPAPPAPPVEKAEAAAEPESKPAAEPEAAPAPEPPAAGASTEEQPHFCAYCGHAIPGDAKFCPNCAKEVKP